MKQLVRYIAIILLAALAMLPVGCVYDSESCEPELVEHTVTLSFTLRLDRLGFPSTRAGIWTEPDKQDEGSSFDNTIDLDNGLFLMLVADGGALTHIKKEDISFLPLGNGLIKGTTKVNIKEEATKNLNDGSYRLMVIANYHEAETLNITGCATLGELETWFKNQDDKKTKYYSEVEWYGTDGKRKKKTCPYIPMWGISTINNIKDGKTTEMGTIDMLRSVAKVRIQFTPELKKSGFRLVSAEVNKCNRKLYPFPAGWKDATSTIGSSSEQYDKAFNSTSNYPLTDPLKVTAPGFATEYDELEENDIVFYLPEIKATDDATDAISITVIYLNGEGQSRLLNMIIDNYGDENTNTNYGNGRYSVNRNHLYEFTLTYDLTTLDPGQISYKLECWNHRTSAIGWNPIKDQYSFQSESYVKGSSLGDPEAAFCYVSYPTYDGSKLKDATAYADYTFTFTGPEGAVWKAFLVEDGIEYSAENKFSTGSSGSIPELTYSGVANTPGGFFFGTGNTDKENWRASTTGRARPKDKPFHLKIGTRISSTDFESKEPVSDGDNLKLNSNGKYWQDLKSVPSCYLVIKVAYDGVNFSKRLPINPQKDSKSPFKEWQYAGNDTMIQIRQLFPITKTQPGNTDFIKGNTANSKYWWGEAEGL